MRFEPRTEISLTDVDLTDLDRFGHGFPHDVFAHLREEAPVWRHPATPRTPGGEPFWVLSRHADVLAAAGDAVRFSSQGGGARSGGGTLIEDLPAGFAAGVLLNMMDDPRHGHLRRLVTPSVSPHALRRLEAELRERAGALVEAAVARGSCDLVPDVAAELPLQAIALLLGIPQEDRHRLFSWASATLDYSDRELGETSERARAANLEMFEYATALLAARRESPGDDMLSAFVHGHVPGSTATAGELEQQMFFHLLIAAGSETTRNTIAIGLLGLLERPGLWSEIRADRRLVPGVVEEMLRWASSTPYNRRTATSDLEIHGHKVSAGDKVTLWWASANRDAAVFADPDRFDPRREPNRHLAFGHGAHHCLGATLARTEIRLVLEALLDRVRAIEIDGSLEWVRSNKHTGLRRMPVRLFRAS